jgi:hypothetical protein
MGRPGTAAVAEAGARERVETFMLCCECSSWPLLYENAETHGVHLCGVRLCGAFSCIAVTPRSWPFIRKRNRLCSKKMQE